MQIEYMHPDALTPFDKNPRKNDHAVDAVARSIEVFGFNCPIVVGPDNRICAGHTRWKAARKLGLEAIPVVKVDALAAEKFVAFNLADNQTSRLAQWQDDLLAELLGLLANSQLEWGTLGFTTEEIEARLKPAAELDWDLADETLKDEVTAGWAMIPLRVPVGAKATYRAALSELAKKNAVKDKDPAVAAGKVVGRLLGLEV